MRFYFSKYFLILFLILFSHRLLSCMCIEGTVAENIEYADFYALGMVMFKSLDMATEYDMINYILPLKIYKGDSYSVQKIRSSRYSSCGIKFDSGSIWYIGAYYSKNVYRTGSCSGTIRLEPFVKSFNNYDEYLMNHNRMISDRKSMLRSLEENGVSDYSNYFFHKPIHCYHLEVLDTSDLNNYISIFLEISYDDNLNFEKVDILKTTGSNLLDSKIIKSISGKLEFRDEWTLSNNNYNIYWSASYEFKEGRYVIIDDRY